MIQFGNIIIEGFCSIPYIELNLGSKGITVIRGATGEGKTTILSALVWGAYGKNLKGKSDVNTWEKYRPKNYNGTKVEIYFGKDGKTHKITRCLKYKGEVNGAKGKDRLIYEIDAVEVSEKDKGEIQALINADLGMSYSLFMNSILFGQGMKRLIQESSSYKKDLFEEIFELEYISKARDIAKGYYTEALREYNEISQKYSSSKEKKQSIQRMLDDLKKQANHVKNDLSSRVKVLEKKLSLLAKAKKENELKETVTYKNHIEQRIQEARDNQKELLNKINDAKKKTRVSLEEFIGVIIKLLKRGDIKNSLKRLMEVKKAFGDIERLQDKCSKLADKISNYRDKLEELRDQEYEANKVQRDIDLTHVEIKKLLSEKRAGVNLGLIKKYKTQLSTLSDKLQSIESEMEEKRAKVDNYKWVMDDPLGNRGIKAFLFESSLDILNETLESYSEVLGFSILFYVDIQGVKKDFNTQIIMDGIEVSYEELSGGQKTLVNIAMAFAMNEVMTKAKGINIAFLDEVFENLSSEYVDLVIGLIRKIYKDKTLYLISHHESLPIPNARVLTVTRERGLSQYH
jgi:DNA repair exonuclease SbcCD ATPase subunit|nr:MAG TPA: STRUCTURAL MAINTENANCE OF CHROMOSOMES PROTEIN [Caudoviricetes sp.]